MRLIRLFISTAFLAACITVLAMCVYSLVTGSSALSIPGVVHAIREINWFVVAVVSAFFGILNVLAQFQPFRWLLDLFWWVDILLKAVTGQR
jgi:hypothetical protein